MSKLENLTQAPEAEFKITIYFVKLTVKFPCRMSLQQAGKPITPEVDPSGNTFTFNQDVTLKVEADTDLEISAYLTTEKGGSILAGVISSSINNLAGR